MPRRPGSPPARPRPGPARKRRRSLTWDAHSLALPGDLPAGRYSLVTGLYDWQTGRRVPLVGPDGNGSGDEFVLGYVTDRSRRSAAARPGLPDGARSLRLAIGA